MVPTGPANDSATIGLGKTVAVNTAQSIFTLLNAGTINIDASTFTLQGGGSTTNTGTINVGSGSTAALQMSNSIANSGGFINIANGSVLNQFTGAITGGTISTAGTGALVAFSNGGNILSGVTFSGLIDAATIANSRERIGNGVTLNGAVNIANGGIVSFYSTLGAANSIGGSGTFNLNDAGARLAIDGTGSTTLGSGITVRGQGNFGSPINVGGDNALTLNGMVSADVSGGTLNIVAPGNGGGSSFVNNGTLRAINGGTLLLSTNIASNLGSQIVAGAGSPVVQNGVILNGVINVSGTGSFQAISSGNNMLDGVNFTGTLDTATIANLRQRFTNGATLTAR